MISVEREREWDSYGVREPRVDLPCSADEIDIFTRIYIRNDESFMEDFSHGIHFFVNIRSRVTWRWKIRGRKMTFKLMMSPYARYQSTHVSTPLDTILRLLEFLRMKQKCWQRKTFFIIFLKLRLHTSLAIRILFPDKIIHIAVKAHEIVLFLCVSP